MTMNMTADERLALAERFSAAVDRRDLPALAALLDEQVAVWHNIDQRTHGKAQALAGIHAFNTDVHASGYRNIRRSATPEGVVQQHDLEVTFAEGGPTRSIAVCIVFQMAAGRIVRLDEYLDSGAFAAAS